MEINLIKNEKYILLLCVCTFFSTNYLPVNLTYILIAFLLILGFSHFLLNMSIKKYSIFFFILPVLFLASQLLGLYFSKYTLKNNINFLSPLLFFTSWFLSFFLLQGLAHLSKERRIAIYKKFINISIIFFILEFITRLFLYQDKKEFIYAFKKSFFYFDSNFTGLVILSILAFNLYIGYKFKINNNKTKYTLLVLIILTLSRSAIITSLILILVTNNSKFKLKSYILLSMVLMIFFYMSIEYMFFSGNYQSIDGSLNSKFYIIKEAFYLYDILPIENKLFGIGLGNTDLFLNIFAHNIFVTMFLEFGIIGSILFIIFILYSLFKSNHYCLFIWFPILIAGISLFGAYSPYLFIINALIYFEENH
ncbi:hypothetical protein [Proteus mirabilis]|uniref:hypothetical protein n=1 Tax=Proteus mirabilis TaxID=584 RepID=UPI0018C52AC2|nr:hypothetical protein [Proteus mirabilis]HCT9024699.1 hypothetical protein [Proteus mirabilis]